MRLAVLTSVVVTMSCSSFGTTPVESQQDGGSIADSATSDVNTGTEVRRDYPNEVLADKPLAYWRLDDKVLRASTPSLIGEPADVSGTLAVGQEGALKNDPNNLAFGFSGNQDSGLDAGNRFDFIDDKPFTLETWVLFKNVDSTYRHIFTKDAYPDGTRHEYGLFARTNEGLTFERIVGSQQRDVRTPIGPAEKVKVGTWHHVVATYDGSELALWVDALLIGRTSDTRKQKSKNNPFHIGRKGAGDGPLQGNLDEVAVYDHVLPNARIKRHYDAALGD